MLGLRAKRSRLVETNSYNDGHIAIVSEVEILQFVAIWGTRAVKAVCCEDGKIVLIDLQELTIDKWEERIDFE